MESALPAEAEPQRLSATRVAIAIEIREISVAQLGVRGLVNRWVGGSLAGQSCVHRSARSAETIVFFCYLRKRSLNALS